MDEGGAGPGGAKATWPTRAAFLAGVAATAAVRAVPSSAQTGAGMLTRTIPSTGVKLPVIGLGTWRVFDVGADAAARAPLAEVLRALFEAGGSVIDSSPMYGAAEGVVGDLLTSLKARDKAFVATKVWTQGRDAGVAQMRESMRRMAADPMDLMQIHNLVDWRTHLATLRAWKREGRVRHIGVTHYTASAHDELEAALRAEAFDFVQVNYALDDRAAERRLLPAAAERGVAVVVNMPFGGGGLIRRLAPKPLPGWAAEIGCASWAQILLKYLLGHPAVTCVIPGTSQARHMRDNAAAGSGPLPDAALRARMVKEIEV